MVDATALAVGCALMPTYLGGSIGQPQFGDQASLDVQPLVVALAVAGDAMAPGVRWRRPALFLAASLLWVAVNLCVAIAILRFGYRQ